MHPSLRLENLSRLPISLRRFATPASKGSLKDCKRLAQLLKDSGNDEIFHHCIPVFYANLDPVGLPYNPADDDGSLSDAAECAVIALNALRGPLHGVSPLPGGPDLWRRIWAWIVFFDFYRPAAIRSGVTLLYFIQRFSPDGRTTALISETVGVRTIVMHGWADLFTCPEPADAPGFQFLCRFLCDSMRADDPRHLADVLVATDGPVGLASLIVRYIRILVLDPERRERRNETAQFFRGILLFVQELQTATKVSSALVTGGVLKALTSAACAVSEYIDHIPNEELEDPMLDFFDVLQEYLDLFGAYNIITEALAVGLLPTIIRTGMICKNVEDIKTTNLWRILDERLPESTVYCTVLAQLGPLLVGVEILTRAPEFKELAIYRCWRMFHTLAYDRISFMEERMLEAEPSSKGCGNMKCGTIQAKTEFRRCSHCQRVYYCSVDCQRVDWESGNHRRACHSMRRFELTRPHMNRRNLSFMRALVHRDALITYISGSHYAMVLSQMRENPGEPLVTIFSYAGGGVVCYIRTINEERLKDIESDIDWDEYIARASRSGGRMTLHIVHLPDGNRTRRWMFPLRSDSSALHDGLLRILNALPEDTDEWQETEVTREVEKLLEANEDVNQIHE
ncbi:hypothetical protein B0H16DRAFT_1899815 [Mycena metata]|uniref:MYND-type domain-containing protein n=1 Tax=Mycena metata TaxID=1033252 RepID=A0AAD7H6G4_9AGAR|nr:hypothetical protein B0H16DRAFT_1899815 [Mycena metata]